MNVLPEALSALTQLSKLPKGGGPPACSHFCLSGCARHDMKVALSFLQQLLLNNPPKAALAAFPPYGK